MRMRAFGYCLLVFAAMGGCGREASSSSKLPAGTSQTAATRSPDARPSVTSTSGQSSSPASPSDSTTSGNGMSKEHSMQTTEVATFGAGCFWGVEHIFRHQVPGVIDAVSGFSGGKTENPTYRQVCYDNTGHAEVVQVTFDPSKASYEKIVDAFFRLHDPTQVDRQGPDIGDQYRSVIFYHSDAQKEAAQRVKASYQKKFSKPIATTIEPFRSFYKAEDYHQRYYDKTGKQPYCHVLRPE